MKNLPLLELLYDALRSEYGIVITCSDFNLVRAKLYSIRKAAQDPSLDCLSFLESPISSTELWIMKAPTDE